MNVAADQLFKKQYNIAPEIVAKAPGRGNLIGEHTDYNLGFVMPFALDCYIEVAMAVDPQQANSNLQLCSRLDETLIQTSIHHDARKDWSDYVVGSLRMLSLHMQKELPALAIAVDGNVPLGAGVSSSAALEVATLKAANALLDFGLSELDIAKLAQKAENDYVGMPCGIMDQMASSLGRTGEALLVDTQDLSYRNVPIHHDYTLAVVNSGVKHALVDGAYAQLRKQCFEAAALLNVSSLREVGMEQLADIEALPAPLAAKARHVVTENQRVLDMEQALLDNDMVFAGDILNQGHASQQYDFGITVPETDQLVHDMVALGALGARQIGGGFGGSCIALLRKEDKDDWWKQLSAKHVKISLVAWA